MTDDTSIQMVGDDTGGGLAVYPPFGRWTSSEIASIVNRLFSGESMSRIAQSYGVAHSTISDMVTKIGVRDALNTHLSAQNARMVADLFNRTRRLRLLSELADHVEAKLDATGLGELDAKDYRDLAVTAGVLIDKQRLEDGESTANQAVSVKVWGRRALPADRDAPSI